LSIGEITDYIHENEISFTYWCLNPNSGDTGGLLLDNWKSLHRAKTTVLRPLFKQAYKTTNQEEEEEKGNVQLDVDQKKTVEMNQGSDTVTQSSNTEGLSPVVVLKQESHFFSVQDSAEQVGKGERNNEIIHSNTNTDQQMKSYVGGIAFTSFDF
jgi:hypothetical protein